MKMIRNLRSIRPIGVPVLGGASERKWEVVKERGKGERGGKDDGIDRATRRGREGVTARSGIRRAAVETSLDVEAIMV